MLIMLPVEMATSHAYLPLMWPNDQSVCSNTESQPAKHTVGIIVATGTVGVVGIGRPRIHANVQRG